MMMEKAQVISIDVERRERLTKEIKETLESAEKTWRILGDKLLELRGTFPGKKGGTEYSSWCTEHFEKDRSYLAKCANARQFEKTVGHGPQLPVDDHRIIYEIATQPSEEVKQEIVERIEEGWKPTRKDIKEQYPKPSKTMDSPPPKFTREEEKRIEAEVARRVTERVSERLSTARKIEARANKKLQLYQDAGTKAEYRAILQCCHPDKGGNKTAFEAIKRLEAIFK